MSVVITLVGNAVADPEIAMGKADVRASFTLAVNERIKKDDEWIDGEPSYYQITAWRGTAEAVAEGVTKGTRLIVQGKFKPRSYEGKQGEKRISLDVTADTVGVVLKPQRRSQGQPQPTRMEDDPWQTDNAPF
jgi:single-strand DNA-binding protein